MTQKKKFNYEDIKSIMAETYEYFDDLRGGMMNRVHIVDFMAEFLKRIKRYGRRPK